MKEYKIKLTIGAFSKLCFVTVKTLRHYEKIGILKPHEVDEWTHYRYYEVNQMEQMKDIQRLKTLGLSLEEIRQLQEEAEETPSNEMVSRALKKAQDDLCQLRHRIAVLQQMSGLTINQKEKQMNTITIKPLPGGIVASFRKHIKSYEEIGPLCCDIIGPEMQRLGCECPIETAYCFSMDHNQNYNPDDADFEYCEIVSKYNSDDSKIIKFKQLPVVKKAICYSHHGSYDTFNQSIVEIFKYIEENKLHIVEPPRFSYIHGAWDCDSIEDWLTEIQVPINA